MAELTPTGLTINNIPAVLAVLQDSARIQFQPLLASGETLALTSTSQLGRILSTVSEPMADLESALLQVYDSFNINSATGQSLDFLCQLGKVYRNPATSATVMLLLTGTVGQTVVAGSKAQSKTTSNVFATDESLTFNTDAAYSVTIVPTIGVTETHTITWAINGQISLNEPITCAVLATDTAAQQATKLAAAVNAITPTNTIPLITAIANNDNSVTVSLYDQNKTALFTTTPDIPMTVATNQMTATATIAGDIEEEFNSITVIQSPTTGWLKVNNPFAALSGTNLETDSQLRNRYNSTGMKIGGNSYESMYASIANITGVTQVLIVNNTSDADAGDTTGHSFSAVVNGGLGREQEIARAIWDNIPLGVASCGNTSEVVVDLNNQAQTVRFSRPEYQTIGVVLGITPQNNFPENGILQIQQALINYFNTLNMGDPVLVSRLYTPINSVGGFFVNSLQIGLWDSGTSTWTTPPSANNIEIPYNQIATTAPNIITFVSGSGYPIS